MLKAKLTYNFIHLSASTVFPSTLPYQSTLGLFIVLYVTKTKVPEAFMKESVRYLRTLQLKEGGWGL